MANKETKQEMEIVPGIYEHFKGGRYQVIEIGYLNLIDVLPSEIVSAEFRGSEVYDAAKQDLQAKVSTEIAIVVYRPLNGDKKIRIRSVENFTEEVDRGEYKGPRFVLVGGTL